MGTGGRRSLALVAGTATAALALAACGSSGSGGDTSTRAATRVHVSDQLIARAAAASGAAVGERISYTLIEESANVGTITITGTGGFNNRPLSGEAQLNVNVPELSQLSSGLTDLPMRLVSSGSSAAVKLPSSLTQLGIGDGKPWLAIDLHDLASIAKVPELSTLLSDGGGATNPAGYLSQIEAASASGVTRVGTRKIDGVPTTEYTAKLDFSKLNAALPAATRHALAGELSRANTLLGGAPVPVSVWIDGDHLIRRFTLSANLDADTNAVPLMLTATVDGYGRQPTSALPASSETISLPSLVAEVKQDGF